MQGIRKSCWDVLLDVKSIEFSLPLYEIPQLSSPYCVLIFDSNFNCRNWKMRKKCHPLRPFPMYGDRRNLTNHLLQSRKVNKYISVHKSGFCRLFTTCKQSFFFPFLYTFLHLPRFVRGTEIGTTGSVGRPKRDGNQIWNAGVSQTRNGKLLH